MSLAVVAAVVVLLATPQSASSMDAVLQRRRAVARPDPARPRAHQPSAVPTAAPTSSPAVRGAPRDSQNLPRRRFVSLAAVTASDALGERSGALFQLTAASGTAIRPVTLPHGAADGNSSAAPLEACSLFQLRRNAKYPGAVALQFACSGTYLAAEADGHVALDRTDAKSFEHFLVEAAAEGRVRLRAYAGDAGRCVTHAAVAPALRRAAQCADRILLRLARCFAGNPAQQFTLRSVAGSSQYRERGATLLVAEPAAPQQQAGVALVLAATVKPFARMTVGQRQRHLLVFHSWLGLGAGVRLLLCLDTAADAAWLRQAAPRVARAFLLRTECEANADVAHGLTTYRGVFAEAEREARRVAAAGGGISPPLVMFSNADIVFDPATLLGTVAALQRRRLAEHPRHIFAAGRRRNCDVADAAAACAAAEMDDGSAARCLVESLGAVRGAAAAYDRLADACPLFGDDSQDFFIMSPGAFDWAATGSRAGCSVKDGGCNRHIPPLVVGGIAFDNWLTALASKRRDVTAVDATAGVRAFHLNHGALLGSHATPASLYNSRAAHEAGGWARGKTTLAPFAVVGSCVSGAARLALGLRGAAGAACYAVHERYVATCASSDCGAGDARCSFKHYPELSHDGDPPDAFSRPWQRPD
jgi:hypothetical protein